METNPATLGEFVYDEDRRLHLGKWGGDVFSEILSSALWGVTGAGLGLGLGIGIGIGSVDVRAGRKGLWWEWGSGCG